MLSCNREEQSVSPNFTDNNYVIDKNIAINVASDYATSYFNEENKSDISSRARLSKPVKEVNRILTVDDGKDKSLLHVITYKDNKGFAVISGDERATPVLAYSDQGNFDPESLPNGVSIWFSMVKKTMKQIRNSNEKVHPSVKKMWTDFSGPVTGPSTQNIIPPDGPGCGPDSDIFVDNFLRRPNGSEITFDQGPGYNQHIPTAIVQTGGDCACGKPYAGCGPVAVSQILTYFGPNSGKPSGVNFSLMPNSLSNWSCGLETPGQQQIANLIRDVYVNSLSSSVPFTCNTFTLPDFVKTAFSSAGYRDSGTWTDLYDYRKSVELRNGTPIVFLGTTGPFNFNDAHIWVGCGYRERIVNYPNGDGTCSGIGFSHYYMNWGWGGSYNGFFALNNLSPGNQGTFDSWLRILLNIRVS